MQISCLKKNKQRMKNFNEKIKKALKEKQMTQGKLCKELGITDAGFIRMIEAESIKVKTLEQICEILEIPITYFLDIEPEKVEPVGFWKKMMKDMSEEMDKLRIRAYSAEEILYKNGLGNFNVVSGRRGVSYVQKNRKPSFFVPNHLRFHLHN